MEPNRRGLGKHRMPATLRRCDFVHARVTVSERSAIREMAEGAGLSISAFIIAACFSFAGKDASDLRKLRDERKLLKREDLDSLVEKKEEEEPEKEGPRDGTMGLL